MRISLAAAAGRLLVSGLITLGASRLGAQAPKIYFACYVPSSGTVYRINEPGTPPQCGTTSRKGNQVQHIEFSWTDGAGALRVTDPAAGDLSGPLGSPIVAKLLGRVLATAPPTDGQVLTWSQARNAWEAKAPLAGGPFDHGALTGLGDDDHPQYLLADGVRNSLNGFAVTGTPGSGTMPPVSGAGTRLLWYAGKGAFRAGYVNSGQWDDANIGRYSVAIGQSNRAFGTNSVALGVGARADGVNSVAIAGGNATGELAFAVHGAATGFASTAIGWNTEASGDLSTALGSFASTNGKPGAFVYGDASTNSVSVSAVADNQFVVRAARFWFGADNNVTATAGRYIETSTGAFLSSGGTWTNSSDSAKKASFEPVDGDSLLARLASMPIRTWRYRSEDSTVRHMGPTAQDFRAAFSLGDSDKAIATVDADGVSLAAVQALARRADRLARENESLGRANDDLRAGVGALDERLRQVEAQLAQLLSRTVGATGQR